MLGLIGYHFYEVTTQDGLKLVLISRRTLYSARSVSTEFASQDT